MCFFGEFLDARAPNLPMQGAGIGDLPTPRLRPSEPRLIGWCCTLAWTRRIFRIQRNSPKLQLHPDSDPLSSVRYRPRTPPLDASLSSEWQKPGVG